MVKLQPLTVGETTQPWARLPYFRNRLCMEVDGSGRMRREVKAEWISWQVVLVAPETWTVLEKPQSHGVVDGSDEYPDFNWVILGSTCEYSVV